MKYPISREFIPLRRISLPIRNARIAGSLGAMLRAPRSLFRDKELRVREHRISGYLGGEIELIFIEPADIPSSERTLVYYHGGGFLFGAAGHHYKMAKLYAIGARCRVVMVQYRLAPRYPFPYAPEDCYAALRYVYDNADELGISPSLIAVGGDSAGGALAAAVVQMARDRGESVPLFQLLIYPVTDRRMQTDSMRDFVDTPMWDARLSRMMWQSYAPSPSDSELPYASPAEARDFSHLSPAYVETAEFDCLRDEGIAYARSLDSAGVTVTLYETVGTMHAFDVISDAPTSRAAIASRIEYMKKGFEKIK